MVVVKTLMALAAVPLLCPLPAQADDVFSQYADAVRTIAGGMADSQAYLFGYRQVLFSGIEGDWFSIGVLQPAKSNPELFAQACAQKVIKISVRDPLSLVFEQHHGADVAYQTVYSSRGGNAFGAYTDPSALLKAFSMENAPEQAAISALLNVNGIATITRPSADILVVQLNYGIPEIYARCPVK